MIIKQIIEKTNLKYRTLAKKVGLSPSSISAIVNEGRKESDTLAMLCRYKFWKELEIPEDEICKELGLKCVNNTVQEAPASYLTEKEELNQRIEEMQQEKKILLDTITTLNNQLKSK